MLLLAEGDVCWSTVMLRQAHNLVVAMKKPLDQAQSSVVALTVELQAQSSVVALTVERQA
jgi:predicted nucleic acid-binding protein